MEHENKEIREIQDKLGYVDQQDEMQQKQARNPPTYHTPTASTFHLETKQPIPVKPVQFPVDNRKKKSPKVETDMTQDLSHGAAQPIDTTTKPNYKGKGREHASSAAEYTDQEIYEMNDQLRRKILEIEELAKKLKIFNEPGPQTINAQRRPPMPAAPSLSSPANYPSLRRTPSKGKTKSNAENNKSAQVNYHERYYRRTYARDYPAEYHDDRTYYDVGGYNYYGHPRPSYYHHPHGNYYSTKQEQYHYTDQDKKRQEQQIYHPSLQRRKSLSNLHEEQYKLRRKQSQGSMEKPAMRRSGSTYYDYDDAPAPHHPHGDYYSTKEEQYHYMDQHQRRQEQQIYHPSLQRRKSLSNLHEEQYELRRKQSQGSMEKPAMRRSGSSYYDYDDAPAPQHPYYPSSNNYRREQYYYPPQRP